MLRSPLSWLGVVLVVLAVVAWLFADRRGGTPASAAGASDSSRAASTLAPIADPAPAATESRTASAAVSLPPSAEKARRVHGFTIVGIALDDAGAPLASTGIDWNVLACEAVDGTVNALDTLDQGYDATDPSGRFELRCKRLESNPTLATDVVLFAGRGGSKGKLRGHARLESTAGPDGTHDVGRVRLAKEHVLFAGFVVDESGAPVRHPHVSASFGSGPRELRSLYGYAGLDVGDADGKFEVLGWCDGVPLDVHAGGPEWQVTELRALRAPVLDLRIVVRRSDAASLRVRIDDGDVGARTGRYRVAIAKRPAQIRRTDDPLPRDHSDGSFYLRPIAPGEYDLEVYDERADVLLDRVEKVIVRPHEAVDDARLQPWLLADKTRRVAVRTIDSRDAVMQYYTIRLESSDGTRRELLSDAEGWASFRLPRAAPDLVGIDAYGERITLHDGATIVVVAR